MFKNVRFKALIAYINEVRFMWKMYLTKAADSSPLNQYWDYIALQEVATCKSNGSRRYGNMDQGDTGQHC